MLHYYSFSNFRSFLKRVDVALTLTEKDTVNGWAQESPISGQRLTTAMAVMGANASGKTSLIQPLAFLAWFVRDSFQHPPTAEIPVLPHFLGRDLPTTFEVVADSIEVGTILRYRLSTTVRQVVSESVERKTRRGQWRPIFERELVDGKYRIAQNDFGLDQIQAEKVRPNVSLISWAAQFNVPLAREILSFVVYTNMYFGGRFWPQDSATVRFWAANYYSRNPAMHDRMRALLAQWDLGLSDVELREVETTPQAGAPTKEWLAFGIHQDSEKNSYSLPFAQESEGTKTAFALLTKVLPALEAGGMIAYDELDSDLHPLMLEALLGLFSNPETNPHNAQIIFTCHSAEVLRQLQKSQVMLVDKDGIESQAWRLDSMEGVRSDENRVAKYLAGVYGATPRL